MLGEKQCPICSRPSSRGCPHLALAAEARDFVRRCIESSQAMGQWQFLCERRRGTLRTGGDWSPEHEDFMWLETAFCSEFLNHLRWFAGIDYEWRTDRRLERGGFWVLLWSKEPRRLWWELRDEIEKQTRALVSSPVTDRTPAGGPWLFPPASQPQK